MRLPAPVATIAVAVLATASLAACSQKTTATDAPTSAAPASSCTPDQLHLHQSGTLTVATDSPAYEPWFINNDPSNGKGFESAVAYAVAKQLGFSANQVTWVKESFNNSYTPGPKNFDFDINQISITPARAKAVTFSDGYYQAAQAVITLKKNAGEATSLAGMKSLKLGAETGTTSLTAIRDDVQPSQQPLVFDTDDEAKQALVNGQIDALVTDLPSAFYMTSAEIPDSAITGQFAASGTPEEFGMLFEKGNPLVSCVNTALGALKSSGELQRIETKWLSDTVNVPVLK